MVIIAKKKKKYNSETLKIQYTVVIRDVKNYTIGED